MRRSMQMDDRLGEKPVLDVWDLCLDLCLEAINAGSLGISAVIADPDGEVVAKGRNQLFDDADSCNMIRNTVVSHAEINALANLPQEYRASKDLTIYTTVEPCPMCIGALSMSRIRRVVIGSADDHAGATRLIEKDPYLKSKGFQISFIDGEYERLFFVLHTYSLVVNRGLPLAHRFFEAVAGRYQTELSSLRELLNDEAFRSAVQSADTERVKSHVLGNWCHSSTLSVRT